MIQSFGDKLAEDLFHGHRTKRVQRLPAGLQRAAVRKLDLLNAAVRLEDLRVPPGNRLEALRGDLLGLQSIRVNDQWRLVFRWQDTDAHEVRLMDYHR